jgi:lysophospholipase-2
MATNLKYSAPIVIPAKQAQKSTLIMLHGLGDQGDGWADMAPQLAEKLPHTKFFFPNAPSRSITLNRGMKMPGWYDIASLEDINQAEDMAGLEESKRYVETLIKAEVDAGIPSDKIVVGGFSQGGAVALMMLRSDYGLAGVVALSSYLPLRDMPGAVSKANARTPLFMAHGNADQVVDYHYGVNSAEVLKSTHQVPVEFKSYGGMGHSACPQEMQDMAAFLAKRLN